MDQSLKFKDQIEYLQNKLDKNEIAKETMELLQSDINSKNLMLKTQQANIDRMQNEYNIQEESIKMIKFENRMQTLKASRYFKLNKLA